MKRIFYKFALIFFIAAIIAWPFTLAGAAWPDALRPRPVMEKGIDAFKVEVRGLLGPQGPKGRTKVAIAIRKSLEKFKDEFWRNTTWQAMPVKMEEYNDVLEWLTKEAYSFLAVKAPILNQCSLLKTGSFGRGRPTYKSDVDLILVLPDDVVPEEISDEMDSFFTFIYDAFSTIIIMGSLSGITSRLGVVSDASQGEEDKGLMELCTKVLNSRFLTGDRGFYEASILASFKDAVSRNADSIIRFLIVARDKEFKTGRTYDFYKLGLGGIREWDRIEWLLGVNSYRQQAASPATEEQMKKAWQAFLRQVTLRDQGRALSKLGEEEQVQYVKDAIAIFDLNVEVMRELWPGQEDELPIFLTSAGWKSKMSVEEIEDILGVIKDRPLHVRLIPYDNNIGIHELVIAVQRDRLGLLQEMTGALAMYTLNIRSARVRTFREGILNHFWVEGVPRDDEERTRLINGLDDVLSLIIEKQEKSVEELFNERNIPYAFPLKGLRGRVPTVVFTEEARIGRVLTILTQERNRPGLLHLIARWLSEHKVNIFESDRIRTQENMILDSVVITEEGGKILSPQRCQEIARGLKEFLSHSTIEGETFRSGGKRALGSAAAPADLIFSNHTDTQI